MDIQYKNKSGIYKITSKKHHAFYVGSAKNLYNRLHCHFSMLRKGCHTNRKLQKIYDKYGIKNLSWEVIEVCELSKLIEREQYYLDKLKPTINICRKAQNTEGFKFNTYQLKHLSNVRKGKYPLHLAGTNTTPEARAKISQKAKERIKKYGLHPNFYNGSIKANTGRKQSKEEIYSRSLSQSKLNYEQVKEIRQMLNNGIYQKEIAKLFNISQRLVCRVNLRIGIYGTI